MHGQTEISNKEIQRILPQAHPFLFVDKVTEIANDYVIGVKCVTCNETYLQGHFPPNDPVFPGVLLIEACGQLGGILIHKKFPENGRGYLAQVTQFKFLSFVYPGDRIRMKATFLSSLGRFAEVRVEAGVEDNAVCKGQIQYFFEKRSGK